MRNLPECVRRILLCGSLALVAGCSERAAEEETVEKTSLALTTAEVSMNVTLPEGVSVNAFALGANRRLTVADGVRITSATGPFRVFSTGTETTELGADAAVGASGAPGTVLSRGRVWLRERARVLGDVRTEGAFDTQNVWTVDGSVNANATIPLAAPLNWSVKFQSGGPNVSLEPDQTRTLAPGAFGTVNVKSRSKLRLASGIYYLSSLTFEPQSELILADANGPVILYVSGGVTWRGKVVGASASERLMLASVGTTQLDLDAPFRGSVFAPAAALRLGPVDGSGHEGSFYAKTLDVLARNPVRFVPFAHWGYLFPPKVTAECRNRAKVSHAAALFTVENPLDFPVTIPVGPNNFVSAAPAKNEPLYVFAPGRREKHYWLEYGGPSVTWTLLGNAVTVPDSARVCDRSDWNLSSLDVRLAPLSGPDALALEVNCRPEDGCAPEMTAVEVPSLRDEPPTAPAPPPGRALTVELFNVDAPEGAVLDSSMYTPFSSGGYIFREGNPSFSYSPSPSNSGPFTHAMAVPEPYSSGLIVNYLTSGGNLIVGATPEFDWVNGTFSFAQGSQTHTATACPGDPVMTNACRCYRANADWAFCARLTPPTQPKSRLCATWNTQNIDGGIGEDELVSTDPVEEPASFALAQLTSTDGSFTSWTTPFPLDVDGCVPEDFVPSVYPSQMRLELFGQIENAASGTVIKVLADDAAASSFKIATRFTSTTDATGRPLLVAGSNALDELTRAAAGASRAVRLQAQGRDLGLVGGEIVIQARSPKARDFDGGPCGSALASGNVLHLRPTRTTAADDPATPDFDESYWCVGPSDASLKDVWSHEFGHAMQDAASAFVPDAGRYAFSVTLENGSTFTKDFPAVPEECRCPQVQGEYSTLHCIQSLELTGAAQSEGFASAYGKLFYNRPTEADCAVGYVKWTLWPECLPGNDCLPILGLSDAEYDQIRIDNGLQGLPVRSRLDPNVDWVLVRPPFRFSCAAAQKWRNTACFDPAVADPILRESFGNEMDWEQFFWALWAPGIDAGAGLGGGGAWTPTLVNEGYKVIAGEEPTWQRWQTTVGGMLTSAQVDLDNQTRFLQLGRSRGVDDAPIP